METHKLKMVRMQVVKILISIFFIFLSVEGKGQTIHGDFKVTNISTSVQDIGIIYSFVPNEVFRKTTYKHLNKTVSGGNFSIEGDTLILDYKPLERKSTEDLVYIRKDKLVDSTRFFSKIQILNSKGTPQAGVNLLIKNQEGDVVMGFSSNNQGAFPVLSVFDKYIQYLTFSFLGHQEVTLNTDSLFGLDTKIRFQLKSNSVTYTNTAKSEKYLIQQNVDSLSLIPLNNNKLESLKLKKIAKSD